MLHLHEGLTKNALLMRQRREETQHPAGFEPTTSQALPLCYNRYPDQGPDTSLKLGSFHSRSFLNSPLIRRRKKMSAESSEDETESASLTKKVDNDDDDDDNDADDVSGAKNSSNAANARSSSGYHNLETFQRKKLKQKVRVKVFLRGVRFRVESELSAPF